jgi:ferredoxin-NADP reductase
MSSYPIKGKSIEKATHNVLRIVTEKPAQFHFEPGQATDVVINKPGWEDEKRPFTFTSVPEDKFLEFTIKTYPSHKGVPNELLSLKPGDELIISESWAQLVSEAKAHSLPVGPGLRPLFPFSGTCISTMKLETTNSFLLTRQRLTSSMGMNL